MHFEFCSAGQIIFGSGSLTRLKELVSPLGKQALVVTGKSTDRALPACNQLDDLGIAREIFCVTSEPTVDNVLDGVAVIRRKRCDFVIAIGGGSVLDMGKALATMITNHGDLFDYLEVIGRGRKIEFKSAPFVAIPTTAGTGSEVTKNAVIGSPEHNVKVSIRSNLMVPDIALVDPELTLSMPARVTASTGLDALTQLLEAFVTVQSNPLVDSLCRDGLTKAARSLQKAYDNGSDLEAREDMAYAGLLGGLALANARLGAVHGFAGPLGGMINAPHGELCASLLPAVMEINVQALKQRDLRSKSLERYNEVAQILTGNQSARAADGIQWIKTLSQHCEIPSLKDLGLTNSLIPEAVEKSKASSSMKGNPIVLTDHELASILNMSMEQ